MHYAELMIDEILQRQWGLKVSIEKLSKMKNTEKGKEP
jgi:hypothetical protein